MIIISPTAATIWIGTDIWTGVDIWNDFVGQGTIIVEMGHVKVWYDSNAWKDNDTWDDEFDLNRVDTFISLLSGSYFRLFPYGSGMYKLLPQGTAWALENEKTVLRDFIYGLSLSLDRLQEEAKENLDLIFPGSSGKYLSDWERFLGLPKCPDIELNLQQRSASVLAMWNLSPYSNEDFFIGIAAVFGYEITIREGVRGADRDVFLLTVTIENPNNPIYARAGASGAGDRLVEYDFGPTECLINFFKPAHTYLILESAFPDADPVQPSASITAALISGTYVPN